MRSTTLLSAVALLILLEVPSISGGACRCAAERKLPERQCNEDDNTYYRRTFTVNDNCQASVNSFYESLFHQYKGESSESYVKRIDTVLSSVYPRLDCRTDVSRARYLEKYYQSKYARRSQESDAQYFQRVLTKSSASSASYKTRCQLLRKFVSQVDWSSVIKESSSRGYSVTTKHISSAEKKQSSSNKNQSEEKNRKESQRQQEENQRQQEVKQRQQEENQRHQEENQRQQGDKQRQQEEKQRQQEVKQRQQEEKRRQQEEKQKQHEENVKKAEAKQVQHEENVKKIEAQRVEQEKNVKEIEDRKLKHEENVKKIEAQRVQHERNTKEIENRKAQREENVKKIEAQKGEHERNVQKIEKHKAHHTENVKKIEERKAQREENVKKWIKANYKQKRGEDKTSWYTRICERGSMTDAEYVERLTQVKSEFSSLDLWSKEEWLTITKTYITLRYSRTQTETEEEYYQRITARETNETEEVYAGRINLMHDCFPTLPLWCEEKFYEKYTSSFYKTYYKQQSTESNEAYLKRVFTKVSGESESSFWKRVSLTKKTFSNNSCWEDKASLKKLDVFKSISSAKNEQELWSNIQSNDGSSEWSKNEYSILKTFFSSSSSHSSSSESSSCPWCGSSSESCGCQKQGDITIVDRD